MKDMYSTIVVYEERLVAPSKAHDEVCRIVIDHVGSVPIVKARRTVLFPLSLISQHYKAF